MEFKNRKFKIFDSIWSIKFEDKYFKADEGGTLLGGDRPKYKDYKNIIERYKW